MKEIQDEIETVISEFEKTKKAYQEKLQKTFKSAFKIFWEENPKIRAVVWQQYTPYFNDGESCEFGRHDMFPMTKEGYKAWKDDSGYAEEYVPYEIDYDSWRAINYAKNKCKYVVASGENSDITAEECTKAANQIALIQTLPDEIFLEMFGDHCEVIAGRTGFTVEEYDHD